MSAPTTDRRARLDQHSLRLAYVTAGYSLIEGIVAIALREGMKAWRGEHCAVPTVASNQTGTCYADTTAED
ncbi:hypothetical protein [Glycomyces tenuis]|uniref:hypothetical protein n=1 Tax=Glycomyces tenuis TaxID=58116 RepID=UPI0003FBFEE7|nr:hypothetical protein [Glycomyces tenuis]